MSKTLFLDIDGTIFYQSKVIPYPKGASLLTGAREKLYEWAHKGYTIILTTGRKESEREKTKRQLSDLDIAYDQLVMGIGTGPRYLVNDINGDEKRAFAINVIRNEGVANVDIEKIDRKVKK